MLRYGYFIKQFKFFKYCFKNIFKEIKVLKV